ncbi:MAG: hypothetical protein A3F72_16790 [Bacteroidetes bacterium RIFCSPLOWO2_12_FULL_35_15]|nr:MAG: hypothetical protein A3F72_16790 [Bacteroidetes bacterium RIFCSPLOWO2_12_FULL_35_15]
MSFDLSIISEGTEKAGSRSVHTYAPHSVLQSGNWYKIAINTDGIYKLSYSFLKSLGIDVDAINPQNIRIYGNGGGMLPELNSVQRPDDLVENAIYVQGESDTKFDASDYILLYGKGPQTWLYDTSFCTEFQHKINLYSDSAFYFITTDLGAGKRIQSQASSTLTPTHLVTSFNDYAFHENENVNFIKSGKQWFGEYFENIASYNFPFSFPNIDGSFASNVRVGIASRYQDLTGSNSANYSISAQSGSTTLSIPEVSGSSYDDYAKIASTCFSFNPSSSTVTVNITKQTTDAIAWLDYIEVNVRRQLIMNGSQMNFRDLKTVGPGNIAEYHVISNSPIEIWDISDLYTIKLQTVSNPSSTDYQFALPADSLKQFVAFTGTAFLSPSISGTVVNQDLHALANKNFIIIAHPNFYDEALQLAAFHESNDTLSTIVVTPQQIYNEFSSGSQDISAIRDFIKMFYDRAVVSSELPKYVLLFGDGSYDNKTRFGLSNTNYIPTYQSVNSTVSTSSYVSDDFYGLLDDNEGVWNADALDIGIGRFPVKSKAEAQTAINKVFNYSKTGFPSSATTSNSCTSQVSGSPFGDWRNIVCFIADDEDGDLHISDANKLATLVDTTYDNINIDKIYLDSYQQVATPGGDRYPGVSEAINKRVEKGCLVLNYTGHGGEVGLAHERIVEVSQINTWDNKNNLPLFFTATCEFSRFDDPERTSAGEYVFLNPNGGGIALFTTVRLVFASPNFYLNKDFYKAAFVPVNGEMPALGDLFKFMKTQAGGNSVNSRNFTLLGDPALSLSYPKYNVSTDSIKYTDSTYSLPITPMSLDTLKALSSRTISGFVRDMNGVILTNYNGVLYPTIYDKPQNITTLSNDGTTGSPPFTFGLQKNILYKGKVSVTNGSFKFSFIVPKDIAYQYGVGRISYYAENGSVDATGSYEKIIIGGSNDNAPIDVAGPEVNLFLNDNKFVFGGLTDESPDLYCVLKDANGINTVGNGIGHDILATIDADTDNSIVLNDYYQADLNSYKSGTIRYPFSDLNEGKHTLKIKAWDVYNNSSDAYTEFVVAKSAELALSHVLNYPNPFTSKTQFFFEQNQCCQVLNVEVQIFTVSGKLIKNISRFVQAEGYRSNPIEWDGRDDFGDKIGKGVYVYRIKVKTSEGSTAEKYEKLVILN